MDIKKTPAFIKAEDGMNIFICILRDLIKTNINKKFRRTVTSHQTIAETTQTALLCLFESCTCLREENANVVLNKSASFVLKGMLLFYSEFPDFKQTDFFKINDELEIIKTKILSEIDQWKIINDKAAIVLNKMERRRDALLQEDMDELKELAISFDVMPEDKDIAGIAKAALVDAMEFNKVITNISFAMEKIELANKSNQDDVLKKISSFSGISMVSAIENDLKKKIHATEIAINFSLEALQQNIITAPDGNIISHWISRCTDWVINILSIAGWKKIPDKQIQIFRKAVWIMPFGTIPLMSVLLGYHLLNAYRTLDKIQKIGEMLLGDNIESKA